MSWEDQNLSRCKGKNKSEDLQTFELFFLAKREHSYSNSKITIRNVLSFKDEFYHPLSMIL